MYQKEHTKGSQGFIARWYIISAVKIVIAPQAFKESLSALDAARAIEAGLRAALRDVETVLVPVADGGDGTLETLVDATVGTIETTRVTGPLGETVEAQWGALGDGQTAVIEMARAAGLALVPRERRNPLIATTYGVGELIRHAVGRGFRKLIIGIGGSATNDGGAGMAQALGARLLDKDGRDLPFGGASLANLDRIDISNVVPELKVCEVEVACDVTNPLTGPEGASVVYGPQKGASPEMVVKLNKALRRFAEVVRSDLRMDISEISGAGAAGGLGGGLVAFLNGRIRPGAEIVLETVKLDDHLGDASLVITGEGRMDYQTVYNKAPIVVAQHAKRYSIPVIALCGSFGEGYQEVHEYGVDATFAITRSPMRLEESQQNASSLLSELAEEAMKLWKAAMGARQE